MQHWTRRVWVFVGFAATAALSACYPECDSDTIDRALGVLKAQQSCEVDEDCIVVSDFCGEIPGGMCGQNTMNRQGERSPEWRGLEQELRDCAPSECTVCDAALEPRCLEGSCGGP
jgi:hypothetical protein